MLLLPFEGSTISRDGHLTEPKKFQKWRCCDFDAEDQELSAIKEKEAKIHLDLAAKFSALGKQTYDINNPVKYTSPIMGSTGSPLLESNDTTHNILEDTDSNSSGSSSGSGKSSRRFSLYVYQHPTHEQKQHISELYGYKAHHDDQGYTYAHDSNDVDDTSSSSDSYSSYRPAPRPRSLSKPAQVSAAMPSIVTSPPNNVSSPTSAAELVHVHVKSTTTEHHVVTTAPPATVLPAPYAGGNYGDGSGGVEPSGPVRTQAKTLGPPDPSQLPQSYLSVVKSSYMGVDAPRTAGGYMADEYDEKTSIQRPIQKPISTAKDWNAEFQTLVNNNKMEGYREISKLAHDFVYTAKIYGKVIISELTLPLHLKTIKPINIGGVAGGHKYIALGILFKLALDSQGLYVGDQNAMKAAGHELKGLMSYYNARVEVYGSSDGGLNVHSADARFNEMMKNSASTLNIKGHIVGKEQPKMLHSCGDIEGHIGSDGNFYLLDFARVFPPIVKINDNSPPSHLYELIRPELVKSNPTPLSSDALTGWGKFDPQAAEHNYEVKEASYRLFFQVIPKFVQYLENLDPCEKREIHLTQELHRVGINCRYFGYVRRLIRCSHLRKLLLCEMLARTMKCEIMALFRGKMKTADTPSEEPFKEVVVQYFNRIFKYEHHPKGKIWPLSLRASVAKKFYGSFQKIDPKRETIAFESIIRQGKKFDEETLKRYLRASDTPEEEMFANDVDIEQVMKRFNQLTGVGLTQRAARELLKNEGIRLVQSDVKRMKAKVKAHHLVEFAEGMVLWDEAKRERSREKIEVCPCPVSATYDADTAESSDRIADRLMSLADEHFRSALSVSPHSGEVSANWALMLVERARMTRMCSPKDADLYYHQAEEKLRASVCDGGKPKITLDNVLLEYAEFLCVWGTHSHLELDMNEANGLRSRVFTRASRKVQEAIRINPLKFTVLLQKAKYLEKAFHNSQRDIAEAITQNLSPIELLMQEKEVAESPDLIHRSLDDTVSHKSSISKMKNEEEISKLLEIDPLEIIRIEMGCVYIRYGYLSHVYGIMCSKRPHTKMASIKLLKKSGSLFQKGIDMDPYNRDIIVDHVKKFTLSNQFVEFYQSAIGCPSILDFVEDRLSRIAHMSLKDCSHLPIEFIEGIIEYSPKVKMLVLDHCTQISDSTIALIVKKLPYLETLSLQGCSKVTTVIPQTVIRDYMAERATVQPLTESGERRCFFEKSHSILSRSCHQSLPSGDRSAITQSVLVTSLNNILSSVPQASIVPSKPFTFLQNLNLNKCVGITDEKIIGIANMQLPLINVYLKGLALSDNAIVALTQNCPKLAIIEISNCVNLGDVSINAISTHCAGLRELVMSRCTLVTSVAIDKLFRTLHEIRLIDLSSAPLAASDNTLRLIGKYCPSIQYVSLAGNCNITDAGLISMVKSTTGLLELNISECVNLSDASLNAVAANCQRLRILKMTGLNNVTTLRSIGKSCTELVELDISECHKISSDLGYITKGCTKLTIFKLRRCYGLQDVSLLSEDGEIHTMTKLTVLDWSYGNIEFQTIHSITHSCKYLTSLNVSYCKSLTDMSIERIAASLTNLKKLKIDAVVNVTDEGIRSLSEGPVSSSIQVLSLVGCRNISDASAQHILRFHNLRKISLGGCLMTTTGAELIASESFELVKINIRNSLNINPMKLKEKHPHIQIDTTQKDNMFFGE
eukprot:gene1079-1223_t